MKVHTPLPATSHTNQSFHTNILVVGGAFAGLSAVRALKTQFAKRAKRLQTVGVTVVEPKAGLLNILGIPKCIVDLDFAQTQYVPFHKLKGLTFDHTMSSNVAVARDILATHNEDPHANTSVGLDITYVQGRVTELAEDHAKYVLVEEEEIEKEVTREVEGRVFEDGKEVRTDKLVIDTEDNDKYITNQGSPRNAATITFDYVVFALGRDRLWPVTPDAYSMDSYMAEMRKAYDEIAQAEDITIIGAGAVGIEVAGDIKHEFPQKNVSLVHPHETFPPEPLTAEFQAACKKSLTDSGVVIYTNTRIDKELLDGRLVTTDNRVLESKLNHWCTSHKNNTQILVPELCRQFVTPQNNVVVNDYLQLTNTQHKVPHFFVIGDLVEFPIIKSAGWAMYMGRQVANNITSLIYDDKLVEAMPDLTAMPRGMVLVAGNGEIVSELTGEVEVNNAHYVNEYKDYCMGKIRATIDV